MNLAALVPWQYRALAIAALAAALFFFGWVKGAEHAQNEWNASVLKQDLTAARIMARQAEATVQVVTKYVDRVRVVREKGDTLIKEVPVYVTAQDDVACQLNRGFVRLHDAAAKGVVPAAPGGADASAAGITLSTAASTVANNYARCHENAAQLKALQDWIRQMQRATQEMPENSPSP